MDTTPAPAAGCGPAEALLESTPDLACLFDRQHRCIYANRALLEALGRPRAEVIGRSLLELGYAPWDAAMHGSEIDQVFATARRLRGDARFHGPRGERIHDYILAPVLAADGSVQAVAATIRDVTERTAHEDVARRNERRLRAIASASSSVIYRLDPDWSRVQVLVGPGVENPPPLSRLELQAEHLHPDDHARVAHAVARAREETTVFEAEYRWLRGDGRYHWLASRVVPVRGDDGRVHEWVGATTDVEDRRRQETHQRLLLDELNHRVKNTLAVVQSIAVQTFARTGADRQAVERFHARLLALAKGHELLTASRWNGTWLRDVVETAIGPGMGHGLERFLIDGPRVWLAPRPSLALSMALHELCTNAVKYGALSAPGGTVAIRWEVHEEGGRPRRLRLEWRESGGPAVVEPQRRGFGTRLVEQGLRHDLDGEVVLAFEASGVSCHIDVPLVEASTA